MKKQILYGLSAMAAVAAPVVAVVSCGHHNNGTFAAVPKGAEASFSALEAAVKGEVSAKLATSGVTLGTLSSTTFNSSTNEVKYTYEATASADKLVTHKDREALIANADAATNTATAHKDTVSIVVNIKSNVISQVLVDIKDLKPEVSSALQAVKAALSDATKALAATALTTVAPKPVVTPAKPTVPAGLSDQAKVDAAKAAYSTFATFAEGNNHHSVIPANGAITKDALELLVDNHLPTTTDVTESFAISNPTEHGVTVTVTFTAGTITSTVTFTISGMVSADEAKATAVTAAQVEAAIKAAVAVSNTVLASAYALPASVTVDGVTIALTKGTADDHAGSLPYTWTATSGAFTTPSRSAQLGGFQSQMTPAEKKAAINTAIASLADSFAIPQAEHATDTAADYLAHHSDLSTEHALTNVYTAQSGVTPTFTGVANTAGDVVDVTVTYTVDASNIETKTVHLTGFMSTADKQAAQAEAARKTAFATYESHYTTASALVATIVELTPGATSTIAQKPSLPTKLAATASSADIATAETALTTFTSDVAAWNTAAHTANQAETERKAAFTAYSTAYDTAAALPKTSVPAGVTLAAGVTEPTLAAKLPATATKAQIDSAKTDVATYTSSVTTYNTAVATAIKAKADADAQASAAAAAEKAAHDKALSDYKAAVAAAPAQTAIALPATKVTTATAPTYPTASFNLPDATATADLTTATAAVTKWKTDAEAFIASWTDKPVVAEDTASSVAALWTTAKTVTSTMADAALTAVAAGAVTDLTTLGLAADAIAAPAGTTIKSTTWDATAKTLTVILTKGTVDSDGIVITVTPAVDSTNTVEKQANPGDTTAGEETPDSASPVDSADSIYA